MAAQTVTIMLKFSSIMLLSNAQKVAYNTPYYHDIYAHAIMPQFIYNLMTS